AFETELIALKTEVKVALVHYAPIRATVTGEASEIHAFLGTSRLAEAADQGGATVVFHGHAHNGAHAGRTPGGVPVYNVSLPVLERSGHARPYLLYDVPAPGAA